MWLIGAMMCLLAAPLVQLSVSAGNGLPHNALRHHWLMPISCHFRDCKALLVTSLTRVSGAIASVQTFYSVVQKLVFRPAGATRCPDKRQIWHGDFTFIGAKMWEHSQKLSKFRILAINLPLRGHSFAQFLRNSQLLYASLDFNFSVWSLSGDNRPSYNHFPRRGHFPTNFQ